jgi:hypothetical protein
VPPIVRISCIRIIFSLAVDFSLLIGSVPYERLIF